MSDVAVDCHEVVASGMNWWILDEYIPADIAQSAGEQALNILTNQYEFVRDRRDSFESTNGFRAALVDTRSNSDFGDSMLDNPTAQRELPELVALAEQLKGEGVRVNQRRGIVNHYSPRTLRKQGGYIGRHRDAEPELTFAVGLLGVAKATIIDPATRVTHKVSMEPGMALVIDNPEEVKMRPLHNVQNIQRRIPRVSYAV